MSYPDETPDTREAALFAEVLELAADDRAAYLDRACGGDGVLRARVEDLVSAYDAAGDFLDAAAPGAREVMPERAAADPLPGEQEGDNIGPYRLVSKVGEGGCGAVFLAEQEEPVRRQVALKIIKLGMDTCQVVARFAFERQALASMDHPNIARVFDAGETASGRPFFVMELIRGVRVTRYCDERRLRMGERLELFLQACSAIQHAHQKGLIHRDIKPSNILVGEVDGAAALKVIDFGIAKATDQAALGLDATLTSAGQFVGTPAYMSPEQAEMGAADIDTRSDIYSLGVLLYELLAGSTPMDGNELRRLGHEGFRREVRGRGTPSPSKRLTTLDERALFELAERRRTEPASLVKALRGDLDWIVVKALENDPARRYESVGALAADIRRHIRNEPVLARPPSRAYVLRKLVRRHRLPFAAGAAVAASLVVGLAVSSHLYIEALASKARADREAETANAVNEFLQFDILKQANTWAQADAGYRPEGDLTIRKAVERAADKVGERFAGRPLAEAAVRLAIGEAFIGLYDHRRAEEHLLQAVALRETHLEPGHADTLKARTALAVNYRLWPRREKAVILFAGLLAAQESKLGPDHPETWNLKRELGMAYRTAGRYAESVQVLQELVAGYRGGTQGGTRLASALYHLGFTYLEMGRADLALAPLEEALRLSKERLRPGHPMTCACQRSFGDALWKLRRYDEAAPVLVEALTMDREIRGWGLHDVLRFREDLETRFEAVGMVDRALALRREYIAQQKQHNGIHHPHFKEAVVAYLEICQRGGRPAEAVAVLAPVCEEFLDRLGDFPHGSPGRAQFAYFLQRLVESCTRGGRVEEGSRWQARLDALGPTPE